MYLRDALRNGCSEEDLLLMIGAAVRRKKKQHAGKKFFFSIEIFIHFTLYRKKIL